VQKAVLLGQPLVMRECDRDLARADVLERRAERRHESLATEAGAHARREVRISDLVWHWLLVAVHGCMTDDP
jgi:hypothetical protein